MHDEAYMQQAIEQAHRADACGEVPVGAVIVFEHEVLAVGHNRCIAESDPTAHAEMVALREAGRRIGNYRLVQSDLYVTLEPCVMCFAALVQARIRRLIYGASDPRSGACGGAVRIGQLDVFNHIFEISGGVLSDECGKLLTGFFKQRRHLGG